MNKKLLYLINIYLIIYDLIKIENFIMLYNFILLYSFVIKNIYHFFNINKFSNNETYIMKCIKIYKFTYLLINIVLNIY